MIYGHGRHDTIRFVTERARTFTKESRKTLTVFQLDDLQLGLHDPGSIVVTAMATFPLS